MLNLNLFPVLKSPIKEEKKNTDTHTHKYLMLNLSDGNNNKAKHACELFIVLQI